jgi:hypothetical protein
VTKKIEWPMGQGDIAVVVQVSALELAMNDSEKIKRLLDDRIECARMTLANMIETVRTPATEVQ